MANREFATTEDDDDFTIESEINERLKGWRIEKNTNGFYRYRWQLKEANGDAVTHITSSGKVGYARGSKYLPREQAIKEIKKDGKKRK